MKEFNWAEFKDTNNIIAVHCETKEETEDFCKNMHEQGMNWNDGTTYLGRTKFNSYFDQMCYYGDGEYSSLKYAKEKGYKILEWSNYIQKEFTKADLKDGMVIEYKDGRRRLVLNNRLIGKDGYYELNKYTEDMKDKESSERDIMRVFKIDIITTLDRIFHIDNLELIWERKKTKRMTVEEMRQKLEELTGDKIETEPSREEMIGTCHEYCRERRCSKSCVLYQFGDCCFKNYPDEKLKQCYVKVLEDGRKES